MSIEHGSKNRIFCDGDLPPAGENEFEGHEALVITNINKHNAIIIIDLYFQDKLPVKGIKSMVEAERVLCISLDKPIGEQQYQISPGQYSLVLKSVVPIFAVFGRLDVRQENMAYYSVQGFTY